MIKKSVLRRRLSAALGYDLQPSDFTYFFGEFCERIDYFSVKRNERGEIIKRWKVDPQKKLCKKKEITLEEAQAFSDFCGYDLTTPVPTPLW